MTTQTYSATIGGVVYNVTANLGTLPGTTGWFNVKSYGAVGDGVADDITALRVRGVLIEAEHADIGSGRRYRIRP